MNKTPHRHNLHPLGLSATALTATLLALLFTACARDPEASKPNFIVLLTDDQGY